VGRPRGFVGGIVGGRRIGKNGKRRRGIGLGRIYQVGKGIG